MSKEDIPSLNVSGLILTGDIATSKNIVNCLKQLAIFDFPIYFVLGNHDYYGSSFTKVDEEIKELTNKYENLIWLDKTIMVIDEVLLIGTTGWYDARVGNLKSPVKLNDWRLIEEFKSGFFNRDLLVNVIRELSNIYLEQIKEKMKNINSSSLNEIKKIIIATHVPPYMEACVYQNQVSNSNYLPWFTNIALGAMIDEYSLIHPEKEIMILCGHSHEANIFKKYRITCYTGKAQYNDPSLAGKLDLTNLSVDLFR